jgi:hypothetical protein
MTVCLGLAMNLLLDLGAWWTAGYLRFQTGMLDRLLASATLAVGWAILGLQLLGPLGFLSTEPLFVWSSLLFLIGVLCRFLRPISRGESVPAERPPEREPWRVEALASMTLVLWTASFLGMQSLLMPVKVVSDGPIYHLYFAARWWKAGRLFLVPVPFGENAATYFPANGDLWFTWLMVTWGGDRLAKVGQAPFLFLAAMAAYGLGRMAGASRNSSLIAACVFVTSTAFLIFSFEANVDTIFVACYLAATYFILRFAHHGSGKSSLVLAGLAAGLSLGTKPVGVVFLPALFLFAVGAIWTCRRSAKETVAAAALMLLCSLVTSGFWFGRNVLLTGNPFYPLQVEMLDKTIVRGWYDSQAMRFSPYYLPLSDWRALGDTLLAVVDPRLAPLWIAALAGGWSLGGRGRLPRGHDRLTWALALLAILNIALFWICIPYRTQQRFMLQALGLGVTPLARLLDRARIVSLLAGLLLALHMMTPQAWPIAWGNAIPWDLSSTIPNAVGSPLPVLARLERVLQSRSASVAFSSLAWLLAAGGCAGVAVWGWSRAGAHSRRAIRNKAIEAVGLLGLLSLCAIDTGAPGTDSRLLFYPAFRDFYPGWLNLEARSGPSGSRVAYAGTNIPYYLFGSGLRNEVRYINVDRHRGWLMHDYHQAAVSEGQPTWSNSRPGWDRLHPDFNDWLANLEAERIQLLVVTHVNPGEGPHNVADAEGFPLERRWADSHPGFFELLYGPNEHDKLFRLYRFRPR